MTDLNDYLRRLDSYWSEQEHLARQRDRASGRPEAPQVFDYDADPVTLTHATGESLPLYPYTQVIDGVERLFEATSSGDYATVIDDELVYAADLENGPGPQHPRLVPVDG